MEMAGASIVLYAALLLALRVASSPTDLEVPEAVG
jgi:hypothetical protein